MGMCFLYGNGGGESLNFSIRAYESEDAMKAAAPRENTIGIVTQIPIKGFALSAREPGIAYQEKDMLEGATIGKGYINDSGGVASQTASHPELYTENYIPVEFGKTYKWAYTVSAANSMYVSFAEYDSTKKFISPRIVPTSNVTGTAADGTYTPSAEKAAYVRVSWRTFSGAESTMKFVDPENEYSTGVENGMVWVQTSAGSQVEFNALRKNTIQVCPSAVKQYQEGAWAEVTASIFQNGEWANFWNGELFQNGNQYADITGGYQAVSGTLAQSTPNLIFSAGAERLVVGSVKKIDVTDYTKLHCIGKGRGDYANQGGTSARTPVIGLASAVAATGATFAAKMNMTVGYTGDVAELTEEKTLDITSLTGEYYIAAQIIESHTGATLGIKKLWLS